MTINPFWKLILKAETQDRHLAIETLSSSAILPFEFEFVDESSNQIYSWKCKKPNPLFKDNYLC